MSGVTSPRRPLNVSLPADLVAEAKQLGVNVSQACEQGVKAKVKEARAEAWLRENLPALEAYNQHIEKHGMTLADYRPAFE